MSIPDDIRTTAEDIATRSTYKGPTWAEQAISEALLAERERAAKIAEGPVFVRPECCRDTADAIAAAIRTPDNPATQAGEKP